jgi:hypothetical protein
MTWVVILIYTAMLLRKKGSHILSTEAAVAAWANTVTPQYPEVAPPSHRVYMNIEKLGYLSHCQRRAIPVLAYHTLFLHAAVSTPPLR